jgi:antitoxin (DNA-binding transcriptional repressor) of toxin-antitoxin stability system
MVKVGIAEAKDNLAKLIKLAEKGAVITILRHGHPVVELRRLDPQPRRRGEDPVQDLLDDCVTSL